MIRFDDGTTDGAISADGRISGCHVHGLFGETAFRKAVLAALGAESSGENYAVRVERSLDDIAATLEKNLDIAALVRIAA
jgi:adenosylcobyric acid synthase